MIVATQFRDARSSQEVTSRAHQPCGTVPVWRVSHRYEPLNLKSLTDLRKSDWSSAAVSWGPRDHFAVKGTNLNHERIHLCLHEKAISISLSSTYHLYCRALFPPK
jgi:hypothetical protein